MLSTTFELIVSGIKNPYEVCPGVLLKTSITFCSSAYFLSSKNVVILLGLIDQSSNTCGVTIRLKRLLPEEVLTISTS